MKRFFAFVSASLIFTVGCNNGRTTGLFEPTEVFPDTAGTSNPPAWNESLFVWSPYVVVHTPGGALEAYQKAIPELMATGSLKGVRMGIVKGQGRNNVNAWIASTGLDVLWIFDNEYLFEPNNIEWAIDEAVALYPSIKYLQIGNETTTILPKPGPQISIEAYMAALKRIYAYIQIRYPGIILVTQSTFGSGNYGSNELETMVKLGLKEMSPSKLIVGMNVYSLSTANNYSHVINGSLRGYRIWVTETGSTNPNDHIRYVRDLYPILRNILRAERIYWYALYEGTGHRLMDINWPSFWTSPLYDLLAGRK